MENLLLGDIDGLILFGYVGINGMDQIWMEVDVQVGEFYWVNLFILLYWSIYDNLVGVYWVKILVFQCAEEFLCDKFSSANFDQLVTYYHSSSLEYCFKNIYLLLFMKIDLLNQLKNCGGKHSFTKILCIT